MTDITETYSQQKNERSDVIFLNMFWLGFIIYTVSDSIGYTGKVNYVLLNVFQILGLLLLIPSAVILCKLKIENSFLRVFFIIYILWSLIIILRGLSFDYNYIKQLLFNPIRGIFPFLVPIVLLFPKKLSYYKKLFGVIMFLGFVYLIFSLIFIKNLLYPYNNVLSQGMVETFSQYLSLPAGFLLLTYIFHLRFRNLFSLFLIALTFMLAVIRARRGLIFISFDILFFSVLIYQYANKTKVTNMVLSVFVILIVSYGALNIYDSNRKDTFNLINERIGENTRSYVEANFVNDFEPKDWLIGRGLNGQYFCPGINLDKGPNSLYRTVIETGFLQIILKGGIISLALLGMIAVPAIFKGIFISNNLLAKASGIWILIFFLYAYPGVPTTFSLNYLLVWISIGICYSKEIRSLTDPEIMELIRPVKKLQ